MNFKQQADTFISEIQTRTREPLKPATVAKYKASLEHALPLFGNRDLADVKNSDLKVLVKKLSDEGLSASTISGVVIVVKLVVSSAVDGEGNELYPRTWNNDFIQLPIIKPGAQKAPVATPDAISQALQQANGRDKALVALLAGTGLRIGEALALTSGDWNRQDMTLSVTKTLTAAGIQEGTKTDAGIRTVDLTPELNEFLIRNLGEVEGPLFPITAMTAWRRMEHLGLHDGAHTLRRFRVTQLRKSVPEGLIKFWIGHSNESVTDRYDKIRYDVGARRLYAAKAGLGFQLEAR